MFGDIRAIEKDGEPWFVGKDVAVALGYSRTADAVAAHVDAEDKGVGKIPTPGGEQDVTIINESGLYSLVLSSKLPQAKVFKRWVTAEVLPSIRRHGAYATAPTIEKIIASPEFGIALLKNLQQEQNMRREAELRVRRLQPLADYTALILACPETDGERLAGGAGLRHVGSGVQPHPQPRRHTVQRRRTVGALCGLQGPGTGAELYVQLPPQRRHRRLQDVHTMDAARPPLSLRHS